MWRHGAGRMQEMQEMQEMQGVNGSRERARSWSAARARQAKRSHKVYRCVVSDFNCYQSRLQLERCQRSTSVEQTGMSVAVSTGLNWRRERVRVRVVEMEKENKHNKSSGRESGWRLGRLSEKPGKAR